MLNRACRILDPSSSSRSTSTPTAKAGSAKYSESERVSKWKTLFLKVMVILQTVAQQSKAKYLLGEMIYNKLFVTNKIQAPTTETVKYRYQNGQVIGKPLPAGEGKVDRSKVQMDPAVCQHPSHAMKARGNTTTKWWTCAQCLSRWERLAVEQISNLQEEPEDLSILTFGKYMGSSYAEVYEMDKPYCSWILNTAEKGDSSPLLQHFAQYLQVKELEATYEMDSFEMHVDTITDPDL
jgi:hypothetical protein